MSEINLSEDPASTWGATDAYKQAWNEKYGDNPPAGNASKAEWVDYAVKHGADRDEAEASTVADLKDAYGDLTKTASVAPSEPAATEYGSPATNGAPSTTSAGETAAEATGNTGKK